MPRVSMKKEDMMGGSFFKEGNIEVLKATCAIYQYAAKEGKQQSDPFTAIVWNFRQLGEDWGVPDDAEPQDLVIRVGSIDSIRPGKLGNPNDLEEEPEDLGSEVGTEGNSIFGDDGAKLGFNWPPMVESLKKAGFKPAVIDRIYMPDYVGMKAHLKQVPTGRKYEDKTTGEQKDSMVFVCTKIQTFPYDKKAGSKTSAGKVAGKTTAAPAADDPKAVLMGLLADTSDTFRKMVPSEKPVKRQVFQLQVAQELIRKKVTPAGIHSQVTGLLKNDDTLQEIAAEVGFVVDLEAQTVMFP